MLAVYLWYLYIEKMAKVGIFFFIDGEILIDSVPVEYGEPYGNAIQHGSHYEFWEKLIPRNATERKLKARAYDSYPRGRVVYFPEKEKFCIYYDTCLKLNDEIILVTEKFELAGEDIEFAHDEHYKCARCNPYFID